MSIRDMFNEDANRAYALIAVFIFCTIVCIIAAWTGGFVGFFQTLVVVIALVGGPIGYFFGTANLTKQSEASVNLFKTLLASSSDIVIATVARMRGGKMPGESQAKQDPDTGSGNTTHITGTDQVFTGAAVDAGADKQDGASDSS